MAENQPIHHPDEESPVTQGVQSKNFLGGLTTRLSQAIGGLTKEKLTKTGAPQEIQGMDIQTSEDEKENKVTIPVEQELDIPMVEVPPIVELSNKYNMQPIPLIGMDNQQHLGAILPHIQEHQSLETSEFLQEGLEYIFMLGDGGLIYIDANQDRHIYRQLPNRRVEDMGILVNLYRPPVEPEGNLREGQIGTTTIFSSRRGLNQTIEMSEGQQVASIIAYGPVLTNANNMPILRLSEHIDGNIQTLFSNIAHLHAPARHAAQDLSKIEIHVPEPIAAPVHFVDDSVYYGLQAQIFNLLHNEHASEFDQKVIELRNAQKETKRGIWKANQENAVQAQQPVLDPEERHEEEEASNANPVILSPEPEREEREEAFPENPVIPTSQAEKWNLEGESSQKSKRQRRLEKSKAKKDRQKQNPLDLDDED